MLSELRTVSWGLALTLFVSGAVVAVVFLTLVVGSDSGSAAGAKGAGRTSPHGSSGREAAAKAKPEARESESPQGDRSSIARMVGQRFMVGLRGSAPTAALLGDVRRGEIGGILMFAESSPAAVAAAAAKLRRAAHEGGNPPLLIATDQEGGPVNRFEHAPPHVPLSQVTKSAAFQEGTETGSYLREHGINVDLAPVVDLEVPGNFMTTQGRTISSKPAKVGEIASAFSYGLTTTGVMPVAKHFPGLGYASTNTDEAKSVVEMLGGSLRPYEVLFRPLAIPAVMVSTAFYPELDPSHGAAWSRKVVDGVLRNRLGFGGLVLSDDLSTVGVEDSLATPEAVTAAAEAGVDILMVGEAESFRAAYEAVLKAAKDRRIPRRNLTSSYGRISDAKERLGN